MDGDPMSRRGLGRGLDSLIPAPSGEIEARDSGLRKVSVDAIDANPRQPRKSFDEGALDELSSSIETLGLLQPLLVRPNGTRFELIAGERRLRAPRRAGLDEVPVVVAETDDRGSLERAIVENIHRADLDPIEEAAAYRQLIDEAELTQDALGERIGRNRATIANLLRLLDLPVNVQRLLIDRRLSAGHGKALLGLQDNPFLERLAQRVAQEGLSVRETEDLVRRYQTMSGSAGSTRGGTQRSAQEIETQSRLTELLQTRVRVEMGKRKGKIVVEFSSPDELERLVSVIVGERAGARTSVAALD
jgi:ParB family chromosome partitioning protein